MKSCFFIGHRDAPDSIALKLRDEIENHITNFGVQFFIVGNYGQFDRMAQTALIQAKKRHPDIFIKMGIPYHPALRHVELPEEFDGSYFPWGQEKVPHRSAISRLNRILIQESDFLIAYVQYISGGSYKAMQYAKKRESQGLIHITMLED